MRRREFMAAAAGLSLGGSQVASARNARPSDPKSAKLGGRAAAAEIIGNARKIVTPDGVERLEAVRIGGIPQWISARGAG